MKDRVELLRRLRVEQSAEAQPLSEQDFIDALGSGDPALGALAYGVILAPNATKQFAQSHLVPLFEAALAFLFQCIREDPEVGDGDLHNRGSALFELSYLYGVRGRFGREAELDVLFWGRVEQFLRAYHPGFLDEFTTHFLEGQGLSKDLRHRLRAWHNDPLLSVYAHDLECTIQRRL